MMILPCIKCDIFNKDRNLAETSSGNGAAPQITCSREERSYFFTSGDLTNKTITGGTSGTDVTLKDNPAFKIKW